MISEEVCRLLIEANYELPESLANRIKNCETTESDPLAKSLLSKLSENMDAAKKINVPVCQDTGMAVIFLEIGQEVALEGEPLEEAVNRGTAEAYDKGYLRKSVVGDPLLTASIPATTHRLFSTPESCRETACALWQLPKASAVKI